MTRYSWALSMQMLVWIEAEGWLHSFGIIKGTGWIREWWMSASALEHSNKSVLSGLKISLHVDKRSKSIVKAGFEKYHFTCGHALSNEESCQYWWLIFKAQFLNTGCIHFPQWAFWYFLSKWIVIKPALQSDNIWKSHFPQYGDYEVAIQYL